MNETLLGEPRLSYSQKRNKINFKKWKYEGNVLYLWEDYCFHSGTTIAVTVEESIT